MPDPDSDDEEDFAPNNARRGEVAERQKLKERRDLLRTYANTFRDLETLISVMSAFDEWQQTICHCNTES